MKNINKLIYFLFLIALLFFSAKAFAAEKKFIYKSSNFITSNLVDLDSHIFVYFKSSKKKSEQLENFKYLPEIKDNFILVEEYKYKKQNETKNDFNKFLKKLKIKEIIKIKYDEKANLYLNEVNIKNVKNWEYIEVVSRKGSSNVFKANIRENIISSKHLELSMVSKSENYGAFLHTERNEKKNYQKLFLHSIGESSISSIKFYKHIYHDNYFLSNDYQVAKTLKFLELKEFQDKIEENVTTENFEKVNRILNNFNYNKIYIKNKIATDNGFNLYYIYIKKDSNAKNSKVTISDFKKLIKNFQKNNFSVDEIGYFK